MNNANMVARALIVIVATCSSEHASPAHAQQAPIKRTELATADQSATEVGALWVADIPPGGATGRHTHPTPRFVYVLEGSVILEIDGKPQQKFRSGEGFAEPPAIVHNFRNASDSAPAKAVGFQVAPKGNAASGKCSIILQTV